MSRDRKQNDKRNASTKKKREPACANRIARPITRINMAALAATSEVACHTRSTRTRIVLKNDRSGSNTMARVAAPSNPNDTNARSARSEERRVGKGVDLG